MKKQTPKAYYEGPHYSRRQNIHGFFFVLVLIITLALLFGSCTRKHYLECPKMADLKAHKYDHKLYWVRCRESNLVLVVDKQTDDIVCSYYSPE